MKKALLISVIIVFIGAGILYSRRSSPQIVEVFVCDVGIVSAELSAKVKVSRKKIYIVGSCKCQGVNDDMKEKIQNYKEECDPKNDQVYSCICIGKSHY